MNKYTLQLINASLLVSFLSGCSSVATDHSNDYQYITKTEHALQMPEGSVQSKDVLVIPNEESIDNLTPGKPFTTPRAPFLFYPMVAIDIDEKENAIEFSVPAGKTQTKKIISNFLMALYGEGKSISSQTEDEILSAAFDFNEQGWLKSILNSFTRGYPNKIVFAFRFSEAEDKTLVSIQFSDETEDNEPNEWKSPVENTDAYDVAVRVWGAFGRQLNQSSAYLSSRNDISDFPIWVNHQGLYAIHLNDPSASNVEATLKAADVYFVPGAENLISPVPPEDVARIGDVVDFSIPLGNGKTQKLFNVRRRDLDNVPWDLREYPYQVMQQEAGSFLFIDVSSANHPELASFHLMQRFLNK